MKNVLRILSLTLLLTGFGLVSKSFAQTAKADITHTRIVDASADEVWGLLRKMDDIDKYSSAIARVNWKGAKGVGGERVCYPPQGEGHFKESVVRFDDQNRSYSYAVVEGIPAKGMVNTFKVVDLGYQRSMIVWTSKYDAFMKNPQMNKAQFLGFINQSVGEMLDRLAQTAEKA